MAVSTYIIGISRLKSLLCIHHWRGLEMIIFHSTTLSDIKANNRRLLNRECSQRITAAEVHSSSQEFTWQFSMLNRPVAGSLENQYFI